MNETAPEPVAPEPTGPRRTIRRPGPLPSGRAVLGGLLVTVAGVGVFAAYAGANETPSTEVVVVDEDVPAGHRLTTADLRTEAVDLPPATMASAHTSVDALVGSVTLTPLATDELVQRSSIRSPDVADVPVHEFSFPVDRDRAVDGDLEPGDRVDLLATYGSGNDAYTVVLARDALVGAVDSGSSSALTGGGGLVLTVALASADQVLDVAHASQVASVTVVRATLAEQEREPRDRATAPTSPEGPAPASSSSGAER